MLGLNEALELFLLLARVSFGSIGLRPDVRAKRLRISDNVITPVKRPEIRAPGRDAADTAGNEGEGGTEPLPLGC